ncbi:MAG: hypothetical protein EON54_06770 [Alcaligenaceae bacterium]|nr:MAG: hypothetical protein EON54_06770 [Alcaligenaceae bacterium]
MEKNIDMTPPRLPSGPGGLGYALGRLLGGRIRRNWEDDGFVVLPKVFDRDQIKRYNAIVTRVREEVDDGKDAQGYGDRIGQLHQREPGLLELASSSKVLKFLKWAFGDDPVLMGSLQFQKGTQQEAHIDAIFFWPEPSYSMAGVWVALEDIHPDAGPLFYIPGSHKWPFYRSDHIAKKHEGLAARRESARRGELSDAERGLLLAELGKAWTDEVIQMERNHGAKRVPICLKAGDVVVWHSLLAHGGSPRKDPTRSRLSAVFHYFGKKAKLFTYDEFMLHSTEAIPNLPPSNPPLVEYHGLEYMRFPQFVTYVKGEQVVHSLTGSV